jgi:hypothetical protein
MFAQVNGSQPAVCDTDGFPGRAFGSPHATHCRIRPCMKSRRRCRGTAHPVSVAGSASEGPARRTPGHLDRGSRDRSCFMHQIRHKAPSSALDCQSAVYCVDAGWWTQSAVYRSARQPLAWAASRLSELALGCAQEWPIWASHVPLAPDDSRAPIWRSGIARFLFGSPALAGKVTLCAVPG